VAPKQSRHILGSSVVAVDAGVEVAVEVDDDVSLEVKVEVALDAIVRTDVVLTRQDPLIMSGFEVRPSSLDLNQHSPHPKVQCVQPVSC
jgi:hypothetical protein